MEEHDTNGWDEWRNHVLAELKRLNETVENHTQADAENFEDLKKTSTQNFIALSAQIATNKVASVQEITEIKTKVRVWGTIAGFVSGLLTTIAGSILGK